MFRTSRGRDGVGGMGKTRLGLPSLREARSGLWPRQPSSRVGVFPFALFLSFFSFFSFFFFSFRFLISRGGKGGCTWQRSWASSSSFLRGRLQGKCRVGAFLVSRFGGKHIVMNFAENQNAAASPTLAASPSRAVGGPAKGPGQGSRPGAG
jgi:hypothetical protein